MSFWNGVSAKSVADAKDGFMEFLIGENEAFVKMAEIVMSNSGNSMLVIHFAKTDGAEIKHYIVDNEFKMQKLKQFYIAFGISMGNMDIEEWRGKTGIVVCKKGEPYNGKVYNKVSYLKPKMSGQKAPQISMPEIPEDQSPAVYFDDDIPF